jgi:hypothetical protein
MNWYVVHVGTDFCGTDDFILVEAESDEDVDVEALAYANASQYFEVLFPDELQELREEDPEFDDSDYITTEQYFGDIEEYDPEKHADIFYEKGLL